MAANCGRLKFARMLLRHKAVINVSNQKGKSPLHIAGNPFLSNGGHVGVVRLLLEQGADPNLRDSSGRTPSECVPDSLWKEKIVQLLSKYGAKSVKDQSQSVISTM
jgi:ankyrin repeat protein